MTANDFATTGFIDTWMRAIVARLDQLAPGGAGAAAPLANRVLLPALRHQRWSYLMALGYASVMQGYLILLTSSALMVLAGSLTPLTPE